MNEAYRDKKYLKFLFENSDDLASELQFEGQTTYSRQASAVAEIIEKYVKICPRWNQLVHDDGKKYTDTLERFFGTHQGVIESFLAKVIEHTKGEKEKDKFLEILKNQGFDYVEGYDVEIISRNDETSQIRLYYKKELPDNTMFVFEEIISLDLLEKIKNESK